MSFWIHAFCERSAGTRTIDDLRRGIAYRLKLLTYLFCPEKEESPDAVLARLKISDSSGNGTIDRLALHYRTDSDAAITVNRDLTLGTVHELLERPFLTGDDANARRLRQMLGKITEDVSFCLKADDVEAMGFPLAIAAAAFLVEQCGGVILSGSYSCMVPQGRQVEIIWETQGG